MKRMLLMLTILPALAVGFAARAAELPSFELMGFPITSHQVAVIGGAGAC